MAKGQGTRQDTLTTLKRQYQMYRFGGVIGLVVSLFLVVLFYETPLRDTINLTHLALVIFILLISLYLRLCANSLKQTIDTKEATILLVKILLTQQQKKKDPEDPS